MVTSNDYKKNKYKNVSLCGSAVAANRKIASHFIEVSALGFISNCIDFTKAINIAANARFVKAQDCRFCS